MTQDRAKLIAAVLLVTVLFLSFGSREAEATAVTLTSGTLTGYSEPFGIIDLAGSEFALTGTVHILDLVGLTDCVLCQPGQLFNSFWSFDQIVIDTLTWQGQSLIPTAIHGVMSGPGYFLPAELGPAFSVDLPFTLTITMSTATMGEFDLSGTGILPVTFSPIDGLGWARVGHTYYVGSSVPEPSSAWLLLGGLPALVGVGWLARRTRQSGTRTKQRD